MVDLFGGEGLSHEMMEGWRRGRKGSRTKFECSFYLSSASAAVVGLAGIVVDIASVARVVSV